MNKLKLHIWSQWGVLVLVGLLAVGYVAVAYNNNSDSQPTTVIENAGGVTINNPQQPSPPEEQPLGAISDPTNLPSLMCSGDSCIHTTTVNFADATTTILAISNPFLVATSSNSNVVISGTYPYGYTGATSTIDLVRLNITAVSTSTWYTIYCAAAPDQYATSSLSYNIINSDTLLAETVGIIENGVATTYNMGIGGGSVNKIMLTPTLPWLICKAYTSTPGGFTEVTNTFAGTGTVRFNRTR